MSKNVGYTNVGTIYGKKKGLGKDWDSYCRLVVTAD